MTAIATRKRHKLRNALEICPSLLTELLEERKLGSSYSYLTFLVYERTRIKVDPTTVREWLIEQSGEVEQ